MWSKNPKLSIIISSFIVIFIVVSIILLMSDDDTDQSYNKKYSFSDNYSASVNPPGGLSILQAPQFVVIGFDDNAYSGIQGSAGTGGMTWALDFFNSLTNPSGKSNNSTYDGTKIKASLYMCTMYLAKWMSESPTYVKRIWRDAYKAGFEIGLHSHNHPHGNTHNVGQWENEIQQCIDWLTKPYDTKESIGNPNNLKGIGIPRENLIGWRTPHLECNNNTFIALKNKKVYYDCSIEEGWQLDQDGTNFLWPYTLNNDSLGNKVLAAWGAGKKIAKHPGIWELPVYVVIVPPDDKCREYGVAPGLRAKLKALNSFFDEHDGKIVGFDFNLWILFNMTKAEFLATLKYTLDLHLQGNRAPFTFGAHTDYYSSKCIIGDVKSTFLDRQQAVEEFIIYALTKPSVRIVSGKQLLDWMRNPKPL